MRPCLIPIIVTPSTESARFQWTDREDKIGTEKFIRTVTLPSPMNPLITTEHHEGLTWLICHKPRWVLLFRVFLVLVSWTNWCTPEPNLIGVLFRVGFLWLLWSERLRPVVFSLSLSL